MEDRGAWRATVHAVTKSWTRLSDSTTTHTYGRGSPVTLGSFYFLPLLGPSTWGGKHRSLSRKPAWGVKVLPGSQTSWPLTTVAHPGIWYLAWPCLCFNQGDCECLRTGVGVCLQVPPTPLLTSPPVTGLLVLPGPAGFYVCPLSLLFIYLSLLLFFFLAMLCSLWDVSSLTRDRTQDHHSSERTEPQPLDHWRIPTLPIWCVC